MHRASQIRQERLTRFRREKGGKCKHYGEDHPACLEFHHRDPAQKSFALNKPNLTRALTDVEAEMAKCDLVCKNCHAKIHDALIAQ